MSVTKQTDQEIVNGLKANDNKAYETVYKQYYPPVKNFICKNSGSEDDAKDVFQETVLVLLAKIPQNDFKLSSSLKTYIFAISSNLWLKRLRSINKLVSIESTIYEKYLADYEEVETDSSIKNQLARIYRKITGKCQTLLTAIFYDEKNIDTVTKEFGYTNKHNAQNQKFKCLEQARKGIEIL